MSIGEQMFLGIRLELDSSGMVTGASMANSSLDSIQKKAVSTSRTVSTAVHEMIDPMKMAAGFGIVGMGAIKAGNAIQDNFLKPVTEQAKSFEVEMNRLKFVTSSTAEEFQELQDVAIKTGLETQFSPQEAASGLRMLKAAGLETDIALESLKDTLDLVTGAAGELTLQEGASVTAASLLKLTHSGEDAHKILNSIAQATRETNLQFKDLPIIINSMRDAPAKLRLTSAETFALLGVMRSAGMHAAQAGMQISMFATQFIKNQERVDKYLRKNKISERRLLDPSYVDEDMPNIVRHFKNLGIQLFDAQGNMKSASIFLKELITNASKLKGENLKDFLVTTTGFFGARSSGMMQALVDFKKNGKQGSEAIMDLIGSLDGAKTASRESASAFEESTVGMEKFIEGTKETIQILQGTTLLPALKTWHTLMRGILNSVLDFVKANPNFAKGIGYVAFAISVLAKVLGVLALAIAGAALWTYFFTVALGGATTAAGLAVSVITALEVAMYSLAAVGGTVLAAVGPVVVAIGLLAALIWGMTRDKSASSLSATFSSIADSLKMVGSAIKSIISGKSISEELYTALESRGVLGLVEFVARLHTRFMAFWDGFKDGVGFVISIAGTVLSYFGYILARVIDLAWDLLAVFNVSTGDLKVSLKVWYALGVAIAWIATVGFVKLLAVSIAYASSAIPKVIFGTLKLVAAFVRLGWQLFMATIRLTALTIQMAVGYMMAISRVIVQSAIWIARLSLQILLYTIASAKILLIVLAVAALVAAFIYALPYLEQFGQWLGDKIFEGVTKAMTALLLMWEGFKRWGGLIADVFVEAFKGNFDPLLEYLSNAIDLAEKTLSYLLGETTEKELLIAAEKLGIRGATEEEQKVAEAGGRALASGRDAAADMRVARRKYMPTVFAERQTSRRADVAGVAGQVKAAAASRTINIKEIRLEAKGQTAEEVSRLAKKVMEEVNNQEDLQSEEEFF